MPDLPAKVSYLWDIFRQISLGRQTTPYGPSPLSYQDIKCWCDLFKIDLNPYEVETVKSLDVIYMRVLNG